MQHNSYTYDTRKCKECTSPACTNPSCSTCKQCRNPTCEVKGTCTKPLFAMNPKSAHLPKHKKDLEAFLCETCRDGLYCNVCMQRKASAEFSTQMRKNLYDDSKRICKGCFSPACQNPLCKTCKTCRDPACRKKHDCKGPLLSLHYKQIPRTQAEVEAFLCSKCKT